MHIDIDFVELNTLMKCFLEVRFSVEFIENTPFPSKDLSTLNQSLIDAYTKAFHGNEPPFYRTGISYSEFSTSLAYENLVVAGVSEHAFPKALAPYELIK